MNLHQLNAIPMGVVYLGAAFTMVALLVASYQNKWSCRVFFLLALRLAIGWHFLFEGLHKVHTYYIGSTETNRVFTSEPYFSVADGPLGPLMRKQFGDIDQNLKAKLTPQGLPAPFEARTPDERMSRNLENKPRFLETGKDEDFAKYVPAAVASEWDRFKGDFGERYHLTDPEKQRINGILEESERKEIEERDKLIDQLGEIGQKDGGLQSREFELKNPPVGHANPKAAEEMKQIGEERKKIAVERNDVLGKIARMEDAGVGDYTIDALAQYGRWTAGVEGRASKVKFVSNDVELSAPQRLEYIAARQKELDQLKKRGEAELGVGYGHEQARMKELKGLVTQAKSVLLADADAFIMELKKGILTNVMALRVVQKAPSPSKLITDHPEKLATFFPASADVADATFDRLPTGFHETWNAYHKIFRETYPENARPAIDHAYELAKERQANWYAGRDEFIGKNVKLEAAKKLVAERRAAVDNVNGTKVSAAEHDKLKAALAEAEKNVEKLAQQKSKYAAAVEKYQATIANAKTPKDLADAQSAVISDLDARYTSLKQTLTSALPADVADWPTPVKPDKGRGPDMDRMTMWMILGVGAMLLAGLFTRLACVVGAVFLLMTYLTHPPFPWLPLPPNTEGNPVFINKNIIEMLGLLVVMTFPTGRWMGIDALIHKVIYWKSPEPT